MSERMRRHVLSTVGGLGAVALVVASALPAAAAVDEQTWISPSHEAWVHPSAWSSGETPEAGDTLVFSGPGAAAISDNDLGALQLAGLRFETSHNISFSNGQLGIGSAGISVLAGTVTINSDVRTIGAQTMLVEGGASATLPGVITTDGANELVLDVKAGGTLHLTGNLDALATGPVSKTGAGTVLRSGGAGGGIGAGGLDVQEGVFELIAASIGGTAFQVTGGTFAGDGNVNALVLDGGVIAPGAGAGDAVGTITAWNTTLTSGTYRATIDGLAHTNDYLYVPGATLLVDGATLELDTITVPPVGTEFEIAGTNLGGVIDPTSRFVSPAGDVLEHGDDFVSGGHVYRIGYAFVPGGVITVEYLGLVPSLASTGASSEGGVLALGVATSLIVLGAFVLLNARRRTA